MRVRSIALAACALIAMAAQVLQGPTASAESDKDRVENLAGIVPGSKAKEIRGTVLLVFKKMQDGSWKAFRGMGAMDAPQ